MPKLRSLRLSNFRIWSEANVELSPTINLFHGKNAQGKTCLLESIWCCIAGRSFRTPSIKSLIQTDNSSASIELHFEKDTIQQSLKMHCLPTERRFFHNQTPCTTIAELIGILPGVVIAPDDPLLIGPPQTRRLFLDLQLAQSDPLYARHLSRYNRALRHRNKLLRDRITDTLGCWDEEMSHAAEYLTEKRSKTAKELMQAIEILHPKLSPGEADIAISYNTHASSKENLLKKWHETKERDLHLGMTTIGPHRDDFSITLGGKEAKSFASEGQKKTCVTLLRLASWHRLKNITGQTPLLLVDDLATSLDKSRKSHLLNHLNDLGQVFITSTEALELPSSTHSFEINAGKICK